MSRRNELQTELQRLADQFSGSYGLWARSLQTGEVVEFGESRTDIRSASIIKLAVCYEVFRRIQLGEFDPQQPITLVDEEKVPGDGVLKYLTSGIQLPLIDVVKLMMTISDNTASNICIGLVGAEAVRRSMTDLGLPGIKLYNKFYKAPPGGPINTCTAADTGRLLDLIVRKEVLTPALCEQIVGIMANCVFPFIPRYLPELNEPEWEPDVPNLKIIAKTGCVADVRHEVGAVWRKGEGYVLCVMTRGCKETREWEDHEGQLLVGKVALAVHRYFLGN
jgi:beta-lactamase class A